MKKYFKKLLAVIIVVGIIFLFGGSLLGSLGNPWFALGFIPCLMIWAGIEEIMDFINHL